LAGACWRQPGHRRAGNAGDIVQDAWIAFSALHVEARASLNTAAACRESRDLGPAQPCLRIRPHRMPRRLDGHWFDETVWRDLGSCGLDSPELLAADALRDCIGEHLSAMPESQRSIVVLRDMEEQTFETSVTGGTVCVQCTRAAAPGRMRLMKMVDRFQETGEC
jgi:hypothetical protein